ncbi:PLD-like domain-containing protein [Pustulibacterium marinum]|uniref:PLD-like domain-containing protein n=1 Tax=Pustulibacterium marinum TaxID=1224947 RepID=A0A1I7GKK8_9FLAO|nr:phospholipase D-like domain-containing protein [Pustulibacterium marinum]SFU48973.1 PLD-like domain-containing protein [Pustulibacterium marinum]
MKKRFFDINDSGPKKEEDKLSELFTSKYINKHFAKIADPSFDVNRFPMPGECFFLQSDTAFNAFTFIPMIAKAYKIKELYASTYSISRKVIDALIELHDKGFIDKVTLLISDSMIKRNPKTIDNLMAMCETRANVNAYYAWSHAKVCIMRTEESHFVIEGSGNWAENAHYEQYLFANDKGLYNFRKELFTNSKLKKY